MLFSSRYLKPTAFFVILVIMLLSTTVNASANVLLEKSSGASVSRLQYQLKLLGYYTYPEITGYYGEVTKETVMNFQKVHGLDADGIAGASTLAVLEEEYTDHISGGSTSNQPDALRLGDKGTAIEKLQMTLKLKELFQYPVDGHFGEITEKAVKEYQSSVGLAADGIVGGDTAKKLNFTLPSRGSYERIPRIELTSWNNADKLIDYHETFLVTDVDTGKSFTVFRAGGYWHSDVEPYTKYDSAVMKEIYGGSWSWDRRAIIAQIDGRRIAASMNGMPHAGQENYDNNFNGHFCIHFLYSKVHHSGVQDADHQAMVKKAAYSS